MTTTTQTVHSTAVANTPVQAPVNQDKWPLPYAVMFMATVSVVLWYGIYSAGSAIASMIG